MLVNSFGNLLSNYEIFVLPGRNQCVTDLAFIYHQIFNDCKITGISPYEEFYPIPNGPQQQANSVAHSISSSNDVAKIIESSKSKNKLIVGFSAGAVISMLVGIRFGLCNVIAHSGAILDTSIACKKSKIKFILTHSKNDYIFKWDERYLPAKKYITDNKFNAIFLENEIGHNVDFEEIKFIKNTCNVFNQ